MGKRPGSRQRELRRSPRGMALSSISPAVKAGYVGPNAFGLLGRLVARLDVPAPSVLVDPERAEAVLKENYEAFMRGPEPSPSPVASVASEVWSEVTKGRGVTLANGREVPGDD